MKLAAWMDLHNLDNRATAEMIGGCTSEAVRLWMLGRRMPNAEYIEQIRVVTDGAVTANDLFQAVKDYRERENNAA